MKLITAKNIFTSLLRASLPDELKLNIDLKESSLISSELEKDEDTIGIIPSCDLIKHQELFVSRKIALSFDGVLSNAYFYFTSNQNSFTDLYLNGDVTANEIILSKILFKERYSSDIQLHLETTGTFDRDNRNYLVVGEKNFNENQFSTGLSFSDELSTMIFLPYVNFVIASKTKANIERFNNLISDIDDELEQNLENYLNQVKVNESAKKFITENFNSVYYEMTESEIEGLTELLQLPYFHGIYDDLFELKLV